MKPNNSYMYTEDDTFRLLSRSPFSEMYQHYIAWFADMNSEQTYEDILNEHGWTGADFRKEVRQAFFAGIDEYEK